MYLWQLDQLRKHCTTKPEYTSSSTRVAGYVSAKIR